MNSINDAYDPTLLCFDVTSGRISTNGYFKGWVSVIFPSWIFLLKTFFILYKYLFSESQSYLVFGFTAAELRQHWSTMSGYPIADMCFTVQKHWKKKWNGGKWLCNLHPGQSYCCPAACDVILKTNRLTIMLPFISTWFIAGYTMKCVC